MILKLTVTSNETNIVVTNNISEEFDFRRSDIIKCALKNGFVVILMQQGSKEEERDLSFDGAEGSIMIVSVNGSEPQNNAELLTLVKGLML